jgi:hypothetical protein
MQMMVMAVFGEDRDDCPEVEPGGGTHGTT